MENYDLERIKSVIQRAQSGQELTIAFLGGSITQGSLATVHENTYAYRVYKWWCDTFPQAKFNYVNGGIGGTDSYYGVSRAVTDVLMYQPDFVVVDFSVNDVDNSYCEETFEGVLRTLLGWPSRPAVLILNNVFYDTGMSIQDDHNEIADHYGVPHVSVHDTIYRRMKAGEYNRIDITPDGLHPNDKGHGLVADEITKLLAKISEEVKPAETAGCCAHNHEKDPVEPGNSLMLPPPLTANAYENARRLTIREVSPKLQVSERIQMRRWDILIISRMDGQEQMQVTKYHLNLRAAA